MKSGLLIRNAKKVLKILKSENCVMWDDLKRKTGLNDYDLFSAIEYADNTLKGYRIELHQASADRPTYAWLIEDKEKKKR
jgi:hypothetical protein